MSTHRAPSARGIQLELLSDAAKMPWRNRAPTGDVASANTGTTRVACVRHREVVADHPAALGFAAAT